MKKFDKKALGRRIKELRVSLGYSQDELCNRISGESSIYETTSLSKLENGKYAPSLPTLVRVMNGLGVTPDVFFDCEHLADENELDQLVMQEYNSLPLKKKRLFYRQIQILKEYN